MGWSQGYGYAAAQPLRVGVRVRAGVGLGRSLSVGSGVGIGVGCRLSAKGWVTVRGASITFRTRSCSSRSRGSCGSCGSSGIDLDAFLLGASDLVLLFDFRVAHFDLWDHENLGWERGKSVQREWREEEEKAKRG